MLILHKDSLEGASYVKSVVLVFGVGLIGNHIVQELLRCSYILARTANYSWLDGESRAYQGIEISEHIKSAVNGSNKSPIQRESCRIDILWSAGKGGFSMTESDISVELASFSDVLCLTQSLQTNHPKCQVRFHMMSSAGGLFEGQRNVDTNSTPYIQRPYGSLKLKQEELLSSRTNLVQYVYRPSSVYGYSGLNRRFGLIPTLLWNGARNKFSIIFGSPDTLRDYVAARDVAEFVANIVKSKNSVSTKFILATGKPTTLHEVSRRVQRYLNKQILLRYIKDGGNSAHNTYSRSTYPTGWNPIDLEIGIRKIGMILFSS